MKFFKELPGKVKNFFVNFPKNFVNFFKTLPQKVRSETGVKAFSIFFAIVAGILFGLLILLVIAPNKAFGAMGTLLTAGFRNARSIGNVFYYATPIILTGLSVAVAYRTGMFNIGATGQLLVGGFVAIYTAHNGPFGAANWFFGVVFAAIVGALWAFLPALLKVKKNIHETVTTIMLNYIALYLVNYLVRTTVYNANNNQSLPIPQGTAVPRFGLDKIFSGSFIQGSLLIALLLVFLVWFIFKKTTIGYEFTAVGMNKDAGEYAGIDHIKRSVQSFMLAGAIAGVAGASMYLSTTGKYINVGNALPSEGFMGISVALLGQNNPWGVMLAGLFFGYLTQGGTFMEIRGLQPEIIDVIAAAIVYFTAIIYIFGNAVRKLFRVNVKDGV